MESGRINPSNPLPSDHEPLNSDRAKPKNQNSPETQEYWDRIKNRFDEAIANLIKHPSTEETPPEDK